jgi:hypothetical protein
MIITAGSPCSFPWGTASGPAWTGEPEPRGGSLVTTYPLFRVRADVSDIVEARRRSTALHPLPVPTRHQAAIEPLHQRVVLDVTTFADAYDYDIREW